jgi:K+-transporting ATPase c subunit
MKKTEVIGTTIVSLFILTMLIAIIYNLVVHGIKQI